MESSQWDAPGRELAVVVGVDFIVHHAVQGYVTDMQMGTSTMHRLMCGTTLVKLVKHDVVSENADHKGGPGGATGIRYWTITVPDLEAITDKCRSAGYTVAVEPRDVRPGVRISMVEDPDGNWVEFLENNA